MPMIGTTNRIQPALLLLAPLLILAGCRGEAGEPGAMGPPPPVEVMTVTPRPVPVQREYVGRTMGSREVDIHARVTGIVEQRLYEEGAPVEAGSALFRIDPEPFEVQVAAAEADLARARANLNRAERERRRLEPLAAGKSVSEREVDDARSDVELAAADVKRAEAALRDARIKLDYTTVSAPIGGISGIARKFEGALVNAEVDSLLTTLVQIDPLDVHFSISEIEWLTVQGEKANGSLHVPPDDALDVRLKLADGTVYEHAGRINFSAQRIDRDTGTYALRARFPNPTGALKAGQFVRVLVTGMTRPDAVAVPQKAVLQGPDGKYVYVVARDDADEPVSEIRPVQVGEWKTGPDGETWVVRSGLGQGDRIILDNFVKLQPGARVTPVAGGTQSDTAQAPD